MSFGFLVFVLVYGEIKSLFYVSNSLIEKTISSQKIVFAIIGESIRAFITTWLYINHKADKSKILNTIRFGICCSLLIAAIWIFVGVEFLNPKNKFSFIINDSIILFIQGIISGFVLWKAYKE